MGMTGMYGSCGVTGTHGNPNGGYTGGFSIYPGITGVGPGVTGLAGATGMNTPVCEVCRKKSAHIFVDINLNQAHSTKELYGICSGCHKETKRMIRELEKLEMNRLPLHINHENIFVREAVNNRLAGKVLCNLDD